MEFVVPRYIVIMLLLIIIDLLDIFPRSFNSLGTSYRYTKTQVGVKVTREM